MTDLAAGPDVVDVPGPDHEHSGCFTPEEVTRLLELAIRLEAVLDVVEAATPRVLEQIEAAGPVLEKLMGLPMVKMLTGGR